MTLAGLVKHLLCVALYRSGAAGWLRRRNRAQGRRLTIVTFHRVADRAADDLTSLPSLFISREPFRRVIRFLATHYRALALEELVGRLERADELPENCLLVTFDDGYLDVFEHAVPLLQQERVPATVFLPTEFVGSSRVFWWDECYYLLCSAWADRSRLAQLARDLEPGELQRRFESAARNGARAGARRQILPVVHALQAWPEIKRNEFLARLRPAGTLLPREVAERNRTAGWDEIAASLSRGISIGSHTRTHTFLDCESPEAARREIGGSKQEIESRLGRSVVSFAYPAGRMNPEVRGWVAQAGYRCAMTSERGINRASDDRFTLRRINIWNGTVRGPSGAFSEARLASSLLALS